MRKKILLYRPSTILASMLFLGAGSNAATLSFSGSLTGSAVESFTGRCAPFITVTATGTGSSNLLGAFSDMQSHCTTSLSTFSGGIFTLTSLSQPADSFSGIYSGTASVGAGNVLDFSATLIVNSGTGVFAGASGSLDSTGTLDTSGGFNASFNGLVASAPEPGTLWLFASVLALLCGAYFVRTIVGNHTRGQRRGAGLQPRRS